MKGDIPRGETLVKLAAFLGANPAEMLTSSTPETAKEWTRVDFGARLKSIRKASQITLEAFAEKCGFDKSYMSRLERGLASKPSLDFIEKVCQVFSVSRAWLEFGTGKRSISQAPPQRRREPQLVSHFDDITTIKPDLYSFSRVQRLLDCGREKVELLVKQGCFTLKDIRLSGAKLPSWRITRKSYEQFLKALPEVKAATEKK